MLLDNRFVYQPFWDFHNGKLTEQEWKAGFEKAKKTANRALAGRGTASVLAIALDRMYTLRNQLIHGGAIWRRSVNRDNLRDCSTFLSKLVPYVTKLMLNNLRTLWGDDCYPVVVA